MNTQIDNARHAADYIAGATGITAPVWLYYLNEVNVILAFLTGIASFAFVLYRFWKALKAAE